MIMVAASQLPLFYFLYAIYLETHQWDDIFLNGLPNSLSGCFEILQLG